MKYEIEIPDGYLTLKGKRYQPTGEFRLVKAGECAISYWGGVPKQYIDGCDGPHIIVQEIADPKPFLITGGNGLFVVAVKEYAHHFVCDGGTRLKSGGWRRANPEECERMRSV